MIVYKIINLINGKIYVGYTTNGMLNRFKRHLKCSETPSCMAIHNAIKKYGKENFVITQIDTATSFEELNKKEKFWIKELNSKSPNGYNLTDGGEGTKGTKGKKHSEEAKRKMSEHHADISGSNNPNFGRNFSKEYRKKISKSRIERGSAKGKNNPMYGIPVSIDRKIKMSETRRKNYEIKCLEIYNLDKQKISFEEISKIHNIGIEQVKRILRKIKKQK